MLATEGDPLRNRETHWANEDTSAHNQQPEAPCRPPKQRILHLNSISLGPSTQNQLQIVHFFPICEDHHPIPQCHLSDKQVT